MLVRAIAAVALSLALAAGPAAAGTTVLASVSSSGEPANDESANVVGFDPSLGVTYSADTIALSADDRHVAFGHFTRRPDGTASWQVYVHDRAGPSVAAPTFDANPHPVGTDVLPGLDGQAKANFGFTVNYQNGVSTVPGGAFQFCYSAGKLGLRSTSFDWLVVTNTSWARFQGLATIDGAGALYPFRLDARDGTPDRLILRVWAPGADPATAEPLYKASGDVSGGTVTIHR